VSANNTKKIFQDRKVRSAKDFLLDHQNYFHTRDYDIQYKGGTGLKGFYFI
jgi:uncharacterized protein YjbK